MIEINNICFKINGPVNILRSDEEVVVRPHVVSIDSPDKKWSAFAYCTDSLICYAAGCGLPFAKIVLQAGWKQQPDLCFVTGAYIYC